MTKENPITNFQPVLLDLRQVLECVRVAPLSRARNAAERSYIAVRSKAVSPLRFATALQDAGASIERTGLIHWILGIGHWSFSRSLTR